MTANGGGGNPGQLMQRPDAEPAAVEPFLTLIWGFV